MFEADWGSSAMPGNTLVLFFVLMALSGRVAWELGRRVTVDEFMKKVRRRKCNTYREAAEFFNGTGSYRYSLWLRMLYCGLCASFPLLTGDWEHVVVAGDRDGVLSIKEWLHMTGFYWTLVAIIILLIQASMKPTMPANEVDTTPVFGRACEAQIGETYEAGL